MQWHWAWLLSYNIKANNSLMIMQMFILVRTITGTCMLLILQLEELKFFHLCHWGEETVLVLQQGDYLWQSIKHCMHMQFIWTWMSRLLSMSNHTLCNNWMGKIFIYSNQNGHLRWFFFLRFLWYTWQA